PRAEADLRGLPREPAEHGGRVRAVGLGGPHRVIAQALRLLDDVELVLGAQAEPPVADVHAELHVQVSFQPGEFVAGRRRAPYAWRASDRQARETPGGGHTLCETDAAKAAPSSASGWRSIACPWPRVRRC